VQGISFSTWNFINLKLNLFYQVFSIVAWELALFNIGAYLGIRDKAFILKKALNFF